MMTKRAPLLIRYFWSDEALDELYRANRPVMALRGSRNRFTLLLTLCLCSVLAYFIFAQSLRNEDPFTYVRENPEAFHVLDGTSLRVSFTEPRVVDCAFLDDCHKILSQNAPLRSLNPEGAAPRLDQGFASPKELRLMLVRARIYPGAYRVPETAVSTVIMFPRMRFKRADVFLDGRRERRFFAGERLGVAVDAWRLASDALTVDLLLQGDAADAQAFTDAREPAFLTDPAGHARYLDFMRSRETNPSRQISSIARISIAIFSLLLFLIVESSSEALGMALFMGFDAIGMILGHSDLRQTWLPEGLNLTAIEHFCHAMGDIFRLYFFFQLARIGRYGAGRWFLVGSLYAVPYGLMRWLNPDLGFNWQDHMATSRDLIVATLGIAICARKAAYLAKRGVPWRVAALCLATAGASSQWLWSAPAYIPYMDKLWEFTTWASLVNILNTNSPYLLALSTFINISTLENRVRVLSQEKARAEAIERELELGRSVQQAFLRVPRLPACIGLETFHEAAVYVSGDTYYVHWHEDKRRLTCLLNDVTGHGLQAALKAFACTIVARSIWKDPKEGQASGDRRLSERLSRYDDAIRDLINSDGDTRDFTAMLGVELDTDTGEAKLYRVNYNFPVLIEPTPPEGEGPRWRATQLAIANETISVRKLPPGALLVLVSDGILAHPRDHRELLRHVNEALRDAGPEVDAARVKALIMDWEPFRAHRVADDRTFLVLQWRPRAVAGRLAA